jgi:hypothetical protein
MENMSETTGQEKTSVQPQQTQPECDIQYDHATIHKQMQYYIDKTIKQNYNNSRVSVYILDKFPFCQM